MLILFSAPKLPELDVLSDEQHKEVFLKYASSGDSARFIKRVKGMFYCAAGSGIVALMVEEPFRLALGLIAILLIPCAVIIYRKCAERALRRIILDLYR